MTATIAARDGELPALMAKVCTCQVEGEELARDFEHACTDGAVHQLVERSTVRCPRNGAAVPKGYPGTKIDVGSFIGFLIGRYLTCAARAAGVMSPPPPPAALLALAVPCLRIHCSRDRRPV